MGGRVGKRGKGCDAVLKGHGGKREEYKTLLDFQKGWFRWCKRRPISCCKGLERGGIISDY